MPRSLPLACLLLGSSLACLAPRLKADFEAGLRGWVGRPITAFIAAKGEPVKATPRSEGGRTYTFESWNTYTTLSHGANADGTLSGGMTLASPLLCRQILEVDATGTILSTRYEGNNCW